MSDNFFAGSVFALIVGMAIAAATAIFHEESDPKYASAGAVASAASAAPVAVAELPLVTVTGKRHADEPAAAGELFAQASSAARQ